jgi:hypothetical protein
LEEFTGKLERKENERKEENLNFRQKVTKNLFEIYHAVEFTLLQFMCKIGRFFDEFFSFFLLFKNLFF